MRNAIRVTSLLLIGLPWAHLLAQVPVNPPNLADQNQPKGVIAKTAAMVTDARARFFATKYGLNVLNVTWEDTGRFYGSAVGPNISDVTIQVQRRQPDAKEYELTCMPVVRFPNFSDKTADIPARKFKILVGNQKKAGRLKAITLHDYLANFRDYLTEPKSWKGNQKSLLAERDSHVLVSAQACFLPIPSEGTVEFNPVIFNYQSYEKNPAVLVIVATREGSSATVIDNKRDAFQTGFSWGQRLFFNQHGQRACLTGQRKTDFDRDNASKSSPSVEAVGEEGLNLVLMIQVPLKHKPLRAMGGAGGGFGGGGFGGGGGGFGGGGDLNHAFFDRSNVESAVIGHGKVEGPFTEIDKLSIRRDPKYPIRVTVQFYKATSNGVVSDEDMAEIANQIDRVYRQADYVGSLVVGGPSERPTEYQGSKVQPAWWWNSFWKRHEANTGLSRLETMERLYQKFGADWRPRTRSEMIRAVRQIDLKPAKKSELKVKPNGGFF